MRLPRAERRRNLTLSPVQRTHQSLERRIHPAVPPRFVTACRMKRAFPEQWGGCAAGKRGRGRRSTTSLRDGRFCLVSLHRLERLRDVLRGYGSCLVAYSGGVDSVLLAFLANQVLGARSLAVIADSPSLPRRELEEALAIGKQFGFPVRVIHTREFETAEYTSNPVNRCYFCKQALFGELAPIASAEGFAVIAYGENASDLGDYRPGAKAAAEFEVRAPLREAGLNKEDIRALSAELGLPTAEKPQMACLSSRIPYGEAVSPAKLRMIEAAEGVLRDLGFRDVRVRHHELGGASSGTALARIELGPEELPRFVQNGLPTGVAEVLRKLGYAHVTLDLAGYRRGSLNAGLRRLPGWARSQGTD